MSTLVIEKFRSNKKKKKNKANKVFIIFFIIFLIFNAIIGGMTFGLSKIITIPIVLIFFFLMLLTI